MDSSKNSLESDYIWYDDAYCSSAGDYDYANGTPYLEESTRWSYTLQSSTTYFAVVELYIRLFNGGYAYSYTGSIGFPTILSSDIAEITDSQLFLNYG